jgi:hypothetical protein
VLRENPFKRNHIGLMSIEDLSKKSGHSADPRARLVVSWSAEHLNVHEAHVSPGPMGNNSDTQSGETGVHAENGGHGSDLALGLVKRLENLC